MPFERATYCHKMAKLVREETCRRKNWSVDTVSSPINEHRNSPSFSSFLASARQGPRLVPRPRYLCSLDRASRNQPKTCSRRDIQPATKLKISLRMRKLGNWVPRNWAYGRAKLLTLLMLLCK